MTKKPIKDVPVSFKLTNEQYKPFGDIIKKTGINKSKLLRSVLVEKTDKIVLPKEQTTDSKRLAFLASKTSNNVNQIARQINKSHRGGIVSEKIYIETLNKLTAIENSFIEAMKKC